MESHHKNENINGEMVLEAGSTTTSGGGAATASSRWNPTKEQIGLLENLYKQGIRTPSAEQIQQITARLRAYGHIEGKNVFYWFQNHKARQRQKQKQESIAYINRFLHRTSQPPIYPSTLCPNVLCAPYYLPQNEMGFFPQHPKVLLPGGIGRSSMAEKLVPMAMPRNCDVPHLYQHMQQQRFPDCNFSDGNQETLALFPQHPTGLLEAKPTDQVSSLAPISADSSTATPSGSPDIDQEDERPENHPFFDFFSSGQGSGESTD